MNTTFDYQAFLDKIKSENGHYAHKDASTSSIAIRFGGSTQETVRSCGVGEDGETRLYFGYRPHHVRFPQTNGLLFDKDSKIVIDWDFRYVQELASEEYQRASVEAQIHEIANMPKETFFPFEGFVQRESKNVYSGRIEMDVNPIELYMRNG